MDITKFVRRVGVVVLLATASSLTPTLAHAQHPKKKPGVAHNERKLPRRERLEQTYREQVEHVVRARLNLTDDQVRKLRDVNTRFAGRRKSLNQQEVDTRRALRAEVAKKKSPDQARVKKLMDHAQSLQQQRATLQRQERTELDGFLSPVQQAQYFGLQTKLRRRTQEMEQEQDDKP